MMTLIIIIMVEYLLIMAVIGAAVWICLRYRKVAAGSKIQVQAFQQILNDYEASRYKYYKLDKSEKPADPDEAKAKKASKAAAKAKAKKASKAAAK